MPEQINSTDEVFGVSRELPLNYVDRDEVDQKFIDSLSRKQHIVIYGSSKQGKTSLRKHCLNEDDYVVVSCQNKWTLSDLSSAILKECGFSIKQSVDKTVSGKHKVIAEAGGGIKVPLVGKGEAKAGYEGEKATETTVHTKQLELDPEDTNDVIRALGEIEFAKFIVLEDFHYLPDETQKDFSFSLKAFHEKSPFSFIIVGVWREENRLIGFNGDLTDRVLSVDVDTWQPDNLDDVIEAGATLLNVQFDEKFSEQLLERCFDSVHIVQEACRKACLESGIHQTCEETKVVGHGLDVSAIVSAVVDEQAGRYRGFLQRFADGFQETDLEMPKWIIYAILCCDVELLEKGVRLRTVSKLIKKSHPKGDDLNNGNITQALNSSISLQNKKGVRPLVIDYDSANTSLHVVDKGFLIWLSNQKVEEILEELELPEKVTVE